MEAKELRRSLKTVRKRKAVVGFIDPNNWCIA